MNLLQIFARASSAILPRLSFSGNSTFYKFLKNTLWPLSALGRLFDLCSENGSLMIKSVITTLSIWTIHGDKGEPL